MFYMYMCMLVCIMYAYYVKVYSRAFEFHYRSTALCCISLLNLNTAKELSVLPDNTRCIIDLDA